MDHGSEARGNQKGTSREIHQMAHRRQSQELEVHAGEKTGPWVKSRSLPFRTIAEDIGKEWAPVRSIFLRTASSTAFEIRNTRWKLPTFSCPKFFVPKDKRWSNCSGAPSRSCEKAWRKISAFCFSAETAGPPP